MTPARHGAAAARLLALGLAIAAAVPHAWAGGQGGDDERDDEGDDAAVEDGGDPSAEPAKDAALKPSRDDAPGGSGRQKQDLSGHDLGTGEKENRFARDRFFVDKVDTRNTARGTLIQGSITSTAFGYHERGGTLAPVPGTSTAVPSASQFERLFTDLRLQTDFRHIAAGRWGARLDVRGRIVTDPDPVTSNFSPVTDSSIQSGFLGERELELKELWLVRSGVRSDVFLGRQFVPDLGGIKIDGLRADYAQSTRLTWLGVGGLYPIRGSRSITTDYAPLKSAPASSGMRTPAGRFTAAAGLGAAYRTLAAHGAFGGVALVPLSSESPRVFGTSTGYWRHGAELDVYHLAVVDLVGSNAVHAGLTNLSLGVHYKPDPRLRGTLSFHRVDTETLDVQAQAFLANPDPGANVIQNEAFLARIATSEGRASVSAGLGELQRFEITAAAAYRHRGQVTLTAPPQAAGMPPATTILPSAHSVEVHGAITDRRSIADLRLAVDGSRIFGVGSATYQRTESMSLRASAARAFAGGRGEWEAEVAYSRTEDDSAGTTCTAADITTCFGAARSRIVSLGGNLSCRLHRDWFAMGSAFFHRTAITHVDAAGATRDPAVIGLTGFARIAYRF